MRIFIKEQGELLRNEGSVKEYTQRENKNFSRTTCSYLLLLRVSDAELIDLGM